MSRNPRFSAFTFIVVALAFANLAFGQQPLPQPIPDFGRLADPTSQTSIQFQSYDKTPLTFSSKAIYVLVPVVVTDKDGKPVAGLKKEDFHVQENGERPGGRQPGKHPGHNDTGSPRRDAWKRGEESDLIRRNAAPAGYYRARHGEYPV